MFLLLFCVHVCVYVCTTGNPGSVSVNVRSEAQSTCVFLLSAQIPSLTPHTYTHTRTHTCTYTHTRTHTHTHMHSHIHTRLLAHAHTHAYACTHIHTPPPHTKHMSVWERKLRKWPGLCVPFLGKQNNRRQSLGHGWKRCNTTVWTF